MMVNEVRTKFPEDHVTYVRTARLCAHQLGALACLIRAHLKNFGMSVPYTWGSFSSISTFQDCADVQFRQEPKVDGYHAVL